MEPKSVHSLDLVPSWAPGEAYAVSNLVGTQFGSQPPAPLKAARSPEGCEVSMSIDVTKEL